ncbi:MAG: IS66 family transposase zinc-finger binding domain-containing protein [Oscillospiraceae bacterium]|nr:IS66 family transposase zinc-finger binding domain-containing protein [Oscillospiraceae bacterium]
MRAIGKQVVREEWKLIPARVELIRYEQYAYACRACEKSGI